jgi:hypothetical protein
MRRLGIVVVGLALVVVPAALMVVFGLPYGRSHPQAFAHTYTYPNGNTTHLHIDADITNGSRPCDPIDETATVQVGAKHKVGVCIEDYEPNSIEAFEFHIRYTGDPDAVPPTIINKAAEVKDVAPALDDNPDANDGDDPAGFKLGDRWDCTAFGLFPPVGEDRRTRGVADAVIVCYADLFNPDQDLSADPGLLATIEFTATGAGVDTIDFGPIDDTNRNYVIGPLPGVGIARCGTAGWVQEERVGCFGATIEKVGLDGRFDCLFEDDAGRGTSLGLIGDDWEFGFPGGRVAGTGGVHRFGNRAVVRGQAPGVLLFAFGTCPAGPGMAFALDMSTVPLRILRLVDRG